MHHSCFCTLIILSLLLAVQSDEQLCMNTATKVIPVNMGDNPHKIMTQVRDDPGYVKNLECKWELKASDYSEPRQMLLTVKRVNFDTQNATDAQCSSSAVDVFNFSFSGQLTPGQVGSKRWCKDSDVQNESKLILANLWTSSNYLTVEFRSDNMETRSDAKGVEMDVVIMSKDYCHRDMLFHNGSCYLITENQLTFNESLRTAKSLLGNLATFSGNQSIKSFLESNTARADLYPFKPPLNLQTRIWTGNFIYKDHSVSHYLDRMNTCASTAASSLPIESCNCGSQVCGIAMHLVGSQPVFTCEPMDRKLPALIHFSQIPGMFVTCGVVPSLPTLPASAKMQPTSPTPVEPVCHLGCIIGIAIAAVALLAIVLAVLFVVLCKRRSVPMEGRSSFNHAAPGGEDDALMRKKGLAQDSARTSAKPEVV